MSRILPPPPPLLLTKRVTSFLRANLSPQIHSAMLTTPAGSLLAHASNLPASALRRQAAVAASLWALQGPSHTGQSSEQASSAIAPGSTVRTRKGGKHSPPTVTVQLDSGALFVIRRLRCGMLFICMGGAESAASDRLTPTPPAANSTRLSRSPAPMAPGTEPPTTQNQLPPDGTTTSAADPSTTAKSRPSTPPLSPSAAPPSITTTTPPPASTTGGSTTTILQTPSTLNTGNATPLPGSPSQASILSTQTAHTTGGASTASTATVSGTGSGSGSGGGGASASLMRRHVEELARWLDERLGALCVPEEGIGMGMGSMGGGNGGGLEVR